MDNGIIEIPEKTILKVGDKLTLPLPANYLRDIGLSKGAKFSAIMDKETGVIIITPWVRVHKFEINRIIGGVNVTGKNGKKKVYSRVDAPLAGSRQRGSARIHW
jgi:hypothetical protein